VVKSCLFWKALAIIRKEDSQYKLSTKGCNQVSSRRRALARCIADQRLYLSGNYTDPKGKAVWLEPVTDKDYHGVKENVPTPKRFSVAAM
jgi:hypothetical protein